MTSATGSTHAIVALPERQRMVVVEVLRREGKSYLELSHRLGLPVGSIGPTRQRASHPAAARPPAGRPVLRNLGPPAPERVSVHGPAPLTRRGPAGVTRTWGAATPLTLLTLRCKVY